MALDRDLQLTLLTKLSDVYPYNYDFNQDFEYNSEEREKALKNLYYLQSHGLVSEKSVHKSNSLGSQAPIIFGSSAITHKGMDFLANDGGLSAILGVVTVKFEADTLKAILENRINQSDLSPENKQSMIDSLRELPAESIKHLTMKLLDEGLENLPNAIVLIGTYLGLS
ncbi:hypothetical protein ABEF79_06895 [Acinetobacter sp. ANC 7454]|uniref:hypothetical protein n=1 Tax=Acinetobacter TaxID=469 RepID=UPI000948BD2C|nr:hypothetical protein [Acinetobacter indicus]MCO8103158.1 hypothetical protein [Acinetobacter indicus]